MALNNNISHHPSKAVAVSHSDIQQEILRAVDALKQGSGFGSVEIVLHEGRITQIETREKLRFNHQASVEILKK
jgi:hypothetical protein